LNGEAKMEETPSLAAILQVVLIDSRDFSARLQEAMVHEQRLEWEAADGLYVRLLDDFGTPGSGDWAGHRMRALARLRRANVLMELGRWDEARGALDGALDDAKVCAHEGVLAQALLAAGVYATNRKDFPRAEAFLMDALERYHRHDDPSSLQGRGWAFLALASLYGKTGRLDLAFVTFTKAQDVLGAAEDWPGVAAAWEAQAQLRRAIHDEDRWQDDLAEAVVFYDRAGMQEKADRLRGLLGRRLV
jgi:tetratricopeptide (TPR) repeat protein